MALKDKITVIIRKRSLNLINSIISDLNKDGKNASGKLAKSLQSVPKGIGFDLLGEGYWKFVDQGVRGNSYLDGHSNKNSTSPFSFKASTRAIPISSIKEWASSKGINPFAVARTIHSKGTEASNIFTNNINDFEKNLEVLEAQIFTAFDNEINLIIKLK